MRPLQLPTCIRRLYGASLAELMGHRTVLKSQSGSQERRTVWTQYYQGHSAPKCYPQATNRPGPQLGRASRSASCGGGRVHRTHRRNTGRRPMHCRHLLRSKQSVRKDLAPMG
eukprot:5940505-Pyramimonas_sp.AAC.1